MAMIEKKHSHLKRVAVRAINGINRFLILNPILRRFVRWQHRHLPVPIGVYIWLFSSPRRSIFLGWYSNLVFHADFDLRSSNLDYWGSPASLYWYLGVARHQIKKREIDALFDIPSLSIVLRDRNISILDIGCGVMKEEAYMVRSKDILPRRLVGIDLNPHVTKHAFRDPRIETQIIIGDIVEIDVAEIRPDVIFLFGGVIEFIASDAVERLFSNAISNEIRAIIILGEGNCLSGEDTSQANHADSSFVFSHNIGAILQDLGSPQKTLHSATNETGDIIYLAIEF